MNGGSPFGMSMGVAGGNNMHMGKMHPHPHNDLHRRGVMNGSMYSHHMPGPGGGIPGPGGGMPGHMSHGGGSYRSANVGNVLSGGSGGGGGGSGGRTSGSRDMSGYSGGGGGGGFHGHGGMTHLYNDRMIDRDRIHGGGGGRGRGSEGRSSGGSGGERELRLPPRGDHRNSGKERGDRDRGGGYGSNSMGFIASTSGQGLAPGQGLGPYPLSHPRSHISAGPHPYNTHPHTHPNFGGPLPITAAATTAYSTGK